MFQLIFLLQDLQLWNPTVTEHEEGPEFITLDHYHYHSLLFSVLLLILLLFFIFQKLSVHFPTVARVSGPPRACSSIRTNLGTLTADRNVGGWSWPDKKWKENRSSYAPSSSSLLRRCKFIQLMLVTPLDTSLHVGNIAQPYRCHKAYEQRQLIFSFSFLINNQPIHYLLLLLLRIPMSAIHYSYVHLTIFIPHAPFPDSYHLLLIRYPSTQHPHLLISTSLSKQNTPIDMLQHPGDPPQPLGTLLSPYNNTLLLLCLFHSRIYPDNPSQTEVWSIKTKATQFSLRRVLAQGGGGEQNCGDGIVAG